MQERLLVLLAADGRALEWMIVAADGRPRSRGIGAPSAQGGMPVIGVWAAPALSVRWLVAPQRGRETWRSAARYALEDQVADDLDSLHVSLPERFGAGPVPVAVVRAEVLRDWLRATQARGLTLAQVIPVAALLGLPHQVTIDGLTTLRQAGVGCTIEPELLAFTPVDPELTPESVADPLAWVAQRLDQRVWPDLLSGDFRPAGRGLGQRSLWRWVALAVAVAVLVQLGARWLDVRRLQAQEAALERDIESVLSSALGPGTPRIPGSERLQMQNELQRRAGAGSHSGLLGVLGAVAAVVSSESRLRLKGLEFRGGRLELHLEGGDVRSFDELRERLLGVPGIQAGMGDLNYGKATVSGRLWVERSGGGA